METKGLDMDKLYRVNRLAGELRILAARLAGARLRIALTALLLCLGILLEWAFGMDFFAEFVRDQVGGIGSMDMLLACLKGLMLISTVAVLKYAVQALPKKGRKALFWAAGLAALVMLFGVGLARNDLMHLKHMEAMSGEAGVGDDAQLTALGLAPPPDRQGEAASLEAARTRLGKGLLEHTNFQAVAYILISLGSAICLVDMLEQWPRLGALKWAREQLAKTRRLRALQEEALTAALAADTLTGNRLALMRAAQDLVIRTHLDGLSYTAWQRNSFRLFHLRDAAKLNQAQVYGLRWLRAVNCDTAREELAACRQALDRLKLVEPVHTGQAPGAPRISDAPRKKVSNA